MVLYIFYIYYMFTACHTYIYVLHTICLYVFMSYVLFCVVFATRCVANSAYVVVVVWVVTVSANNIRHFSSLLPHKLTQTHTHRERKRQAHIHTRTECTLWPNDNCYWRARLCDLLITYRHLIVERDYMLWNWSDDEWWIDLMMFSLSPSTDKLSAVMAQQATRNQSHCTDCRTQLRQCRLNVWSESLTCELNDFKLRRSCIFAACCMIVSLLLGVCACCVIGNYTYAIHCLWIVVINEGLFQQEHRFISVVNRK